MKRVFLALAVTIALAGGVRANDDQNHSDRFEFKPGTLVLSRSVYVGTASIITPTTTLLPPGCVLGTGSVNLPILGSNPSATTNVKIKGRQVPAVANGTYPYVFGNNQADGSFGVTSPIFLDNITEDGWLLGTLPIPSDQIVTSFSSKSELALNLSLDEKSTAIVTRTTHSITSSQFAQHSQVRFFAGSRSLQSTMVRRMIANMCGNGRR